MRIKGTSFFKIQRSVRAIGLTLPMIYGLVFSSTSFADTPEFDNIDADRLGTIIEEMGSSFSHTSVSPASSLGTVFGVEAAIIMGAVKSEGIEAIVNSVSPGTDFGAVPHAALQAGVSLPFGIGAELTFIPDFELADVELQRTGLAVKWTLTDGILPLPFSLAVKGHVTKAKLGFSQSNPSSDVDFESTTSGLAVLVSKSFLLVEPYAGFGLVTIDGKLSATADIFDDSVSAGLEAEGVQNGTEYFLGVQANLLILRAAVEYGRILDNDKYSFKLGLKF